MTYKVLYLCHNAEIFVYRTYSTDQYDCKDAARETIGCSNCLYVGDRVWDIEAASLSVYWRSPKNRKAIANTRAEGCFLGQITGEFGRSNPNILPSYGAIFKRTGNRGIGDVSEIRGQRCLRSIASGRCNFITNMIVLLLRNLVMFTNFWYRNR